MKKKRQAEIINIIRENAVETQDMLQAFLKERGYDVTQATVSRDINELHIEKAINENGDYCYTKAAPMNGSQFKTILTEAVIDMDYAMNIVCIKCHAGLANAACAKLDLMGFGFIVGTIAGDDTIFVLTRTESDAKLLVKKLKEII